MLSAAEIKSRNYKQPLCTSVHCKMISPCAQSSFTARYIFHVQVAQRIITNKQRPVMKDENLYELLCACFTFETEATFEFLPLEVLCR